MKTTMKFITLAFMATTMLLVSCDKDEVEGPIGPQGPQGEQGIQGEQGVQGQQGVQGEQGEDGVSNAIASSWTPATYDGSSTSSRRTFTMPTPDLTAEIVDNGLILIYGRTGNEIWPIPITFPFLSQNFSWLANIDLVILCDSTVDTGVGSPYLTSFRYVIIPNVGSSSSSKKSAETKTLSDLKLAGVDTNDYYAVMDHFGLAY